MPHVDNPPEAPRRYSRSEVEVACIEAHTAGRLYASGGEKAKPVDEWRTMLTRAIAEADRYRKEQRKIRRYSK